MIILRRQRVMLVLQRVDLPRRSMMLGMVMVINIGIG